MLTGSIWEWGTEAVLAYCVYWGWHARRYRKIACAKCEEGILYVRIARARSSSQASVPEVWGRPVATA